jgi:hypothetical protein
MRLQYSAILRALANNASPKKAGPPIYLQTAIPKVNATFVEWDASPGGAYRNDECR